MTMRIAARIAALVALFASLASAEPMRIANRNGGVVDLTGKTLAGAPEGTSADRFEGIGLIVEDCKDLTIRGGTFRRFKCAILLRNCEGVVIEGCDVSGNFRQRLRSTPEREFGGDWLWPHENDAQQWRKNYGAGICLENCRKCVVRECVGRKQQNGILLDRCTGCSVYDNDMSFNSGWGLALWRSSENVVSHNSFDWCVRGYSHGVYARGQDSAGILVFEQCNDNLFAYNSATHGGDGFFLYAGHETTKRTGQGGCNGNRLINNDFSHAVANAIEATFSRGNWFEGNRCDDSNYGVWAGYSYETTILGNTFDGNSIAGVAIEHGEFNLILANTFAGNARGIQLWWDDDKELLASRFGQAHSCLSRGYAILENSFAGDRVGLDLRDTSFVLLSANDFDEVGEIVRSRGRCGPLRRLYGRHGALPPASGVEVPGKRKAFLPAAHPRGREQIRVDGWGPLDPNEVAVFPRRVVAWERCSFHVLGAGDGVVRIQLEKAGLEGRIEKDRVCHVEGGGDGLHEFSGTLFVGERRFPISGVLLNATWKVESWDWDKDPREHAGTFDGAPARTETVKRLDYRWAHEGDRFATRASTKMTLPAGRYEVRTVSDDGVRVLIDGKKVQEDWTHHGPTEHKTVVELAAGEHSIVVEHFELTGYAVLSFDLRPVR
jgi:parallel beta-helix repeat protein